MNKRTVAREWLILFSSLLFGFAGTPLIYFHSYEYDVQDLTGEQKIALMTREQMAGWAKEKARIQRHYDSLRVASGYNYEGLKEEPISLEDYLRREGIKLGRVSAWEQFVAHLFSWKYLFETWASVLSVYVIVQIFRSLFWAVTVVARKE